MTKESNIELVKFAKKALDESWGYCLGAFGNILTPTFLNQKLNQGGGVGSYNTKHKSYLQKFLNKRVTDCYGLLKAFIWWNNGNVKYNPSQDRNQEGAFNAAKEKGPISNIPEIPGLVLWMKGHAGIYIGNGEFIECVGAPVGMRKGKIQNGKVISGSKFTHWFKDTYITYMEKETEKSMSDKKELDIIKINLHGKELQIEGIYQNKTNYIPIRFLEMLGYEIVGQGSTIKIDYKEVK